jgi:uncharacterized protein DUF3303
MQYMLTFSFPPTLGSRNEAIARFKQTGGQPLAGVMLRGRWTGADMNGGFVLLESDDASALTEFALQWSDLLALRIVPVIEDAALQAVLQRSGQ